MGSAHILVVDDERSIADTLCFRLQKDGFQATAAYDGAQALELAINGTFDLIVLDLMLPELSGWDVCSRLKDRDFEAPILMLTAMSDESDRVAGLEMGADDYVVKPFSYRELLARIRVLLRRRGVTRRQIGPFVMDLDRRILYKDGVDVSLSPKEFSIVSLLLRRSPKVIRREQILREVWGPDFIGDEKTVAIHMRWIRQKIESDPDKPSCLKTARGGGYYFEADGNSTPEVP